MSMPKKYLVIISLILLAAFVVPMVFADEDNPQPGPRARGRGRMGRRPQMRDRGDVQQRITMMVKHQLDVSDDQWTVIEPKLTKVMTLSRETNLTVRGLRRMARSRRAAPPREDEQQEKNGIEKAADALHETLQSETPDAEAIKARLQALRDAREKVKKELAKAQQDLVETLTIEQQAKLVLMGIIE